MSMNNEIIELLQKDGCKIYGFADLRSLPVEPRRGANFGIIMGELYTAQGLKENLESKSQKFRNDSGATFEPLERYQKSVCKLIKAKKFKISNYMTTVITHKTIGTMAGIGWIGRCALLTTKEWGPALRLTAVLTDAPFTYGTPITKSMCPPDCSVCADICPARAIKGGLWEQGVHRDTFFDVKACRKIVNARDGVCGLCISACSYTKNGFGYE